MFKAAFRTSFLREREDYSAYELKPGLASEEPIGR